jgi:hypothetical protein
MQQAMFNLGNMKPFVRGGGNANSHAALVHLAGVIITPGCLPWFADKSVVPDQGVVESCHYSKGV